jgi:hypothetical protein
MVPNPKTDIQIVGKRHFAQNVQADDTVLSCTQKVERAETNDAGNDGPLSVAANGPMKARPMGVIERALGLWTR